ncbi:MAG: Alkaline phosphatase synthesis sensor protein PhoR [Syntrophorhabdaceae bacterium PtaU1.Bin034]|nr:MAG: Alkaline phosphatase synthesis sensor protein PhoR [Syntrophorhabdaceae bacterium PtaU1.Bin034]
MMYHMKPTILVRMIFGYLAIFIPVVAVSAYTFSQLSLFSKVTGGILQFDHHMRDLGQKLGDSILVQTRYERKYIITKEKELHSQFMLAGKDFNKDINEALSIADTARKREMLSRVKNHYERYIGAFNKEVEFINKNKAYSQNRFKREKGNAVDAILWELKNLEFYTEQDTYERIRQLGEAGAKAYKIAVLAGAGFMLSGIMISFFITRSITRPLSFMRKKTRQVAGGDFEISLDISSPPEIRDLAQDFNLMCERLKKMDTMKSDFFSLMAHELRTPLASIKEGTNLLLEGVGEDFKEKRKEILTIIAEESNRLTDLVNSLLDLSKMEAGMLALNLEESDIRPLVDKAVSGMRPLAMTKNVNIKTEIPRDVPYVKMDGERILQALRNLIGNAVKFTPGGGYITISVQPTEKGVRVSVADTGPGIPEEDLNVIFDKFRQAAMTSYAKIKGTGLGLAIVKHIINAHGGKIWVESETGHGSTFIFLLPA